MNDLACESCLQKNHTLKSAMVKGKYYRSICDRCLGNNEDDISSNAAGYDRRRGYEDNAQDTIQPYDANGPNPEFARLYPRAAAKVFPPDVLNNLKRKI